MLYKIITSCYRISRQTIFWAVEIVRGSEAFKRQKERDDLKQNLSVENGVHLVYINYREDITLELN